MLITTLRVVRISFVSIFLYQVSFVRSDKGFDRVPCKTVGTSQDLARLLKCSQDFLGKPGEKVVLARNNHVWRGKYRKPGENLAQVHLSSVMIWNSRQFTIKHYFLRATPIIVKLNPFELTVTLFRKDLAALRCPSARCREAHLVKDDLWPLKLFIEAYFVFKVTSLDHLAPNKNSLDHFRSK